MKKKGNQIEVICNMGSVHVIQLGGNGLKNCNYWEKIITYYIRESVLKKYCLHWFFWNQIRTQFVGSEFGIFGGFGWICSSVLVGKPGVKRVRSSQFEIHYFWVQPNTNPYPELSEYVISSSRGNYFTRLLSFGRSVKYKYRAMNNFFSSEDFQPNMFKSETDNLI